jgi:energy-coupling factor transporter ATP-binding protein EcfA2
VFAALDTPLVGRSSHARAIFINLERGNSVLVTGDSGTGKSVLLQTLYPLLIDRSAVVHLERVAPWGAVLAEIFTQLHEQKALNILKNISRTDWYADLSFAKKEWSKACPNNDLKAKSLLEAFSEYQKDHPKISLVIEDVGGISPSIQPWLNAWLEVATLVVSCTPDVLNKKDTKRFWKKLEEVKLENLNTADSRELTKTLMLSKRVVTRDDEVYVERIVSLSQGNPGEIVRLVTYKAPDEVMNAKHILSLSESSGAREEKGIAILPIIVAMSMFAIAWRYIARAQGDMNAYVLSGIVIASVTVATWIIRPLLRR